MSDNTSHFIPLDIESGSAERLYTSAPDPSYIRLVGTGTSVTSDASAVQPRTPYVTVNGHFFDFPALGRHAGIPVESTIPFTRDLRVAAVQHDPPTTYETSSGPGFKSYSMDALAERYLGDARKSDMGKELAKEYGGWDHIPADDPRYAVYLRDDLEITRRLNEAIPWDEYERREAWVATVTARATLNGFRADVAGLQKRAEELSQRAESGRQMLAEDFGFPLTNKQGKPSSAPQRTAAGKEAFQAALISLGVDVSSWPRGKDGSLSLGKEVLETVQLWAQENSHPCLSVVEAVQTMNGIRNNASNVLRCVSPEGRVHPQFLPFQSTKRWSVLEPGLTVLKKGVADSEREFLVADDGDVLVSIDLDQIDIRGAAAHAQDPGLIGLLNSGRDIHTEIAELSGVPRKQAKTLDLGWLYGRSAKAMAEMPGMTEESARRVCDYMAGAFPGVIEWQRHVREMGEAGVLLDTGFGGRLRADPQRAYTQCPALVGQSTTRELVAEGLLDLARTAPEMLPMIRMVVHDEVVFSVPEKDKEECARIAQECLSREWAPAGKSVPVRITAGQGKPFDFSYTWGGLYM
jgi:DNA polymerase I